MATYIHGVGQVKNNGVWHPIDIPHIEQNYTLFSLLSGVTNRDGITPIIKPRGVPEDFDEEKCSLSIGERSKSWYFSSELKEWYENFIDMRPTLLIELLEWERVKRQISDFFEMIDSLHKEHGEFRFIFGFE